MIVLVQDYFFFQDINIHNLCLKRRQHLSEAFTNTKAFTKTEV